MYSLASRKAIIVEGANDKIRLQQIITEKLDIICTHGTFGVEKFDRLLERNDLDNREVYIFVDEDDAGKKLRKQLTAELPHAHQIYIDPQYIEVERTPKQLLAEQLNKFNIEVNPIYLPNI